MLIRILGVCVGLLLSGSLWAQDETPFYFSSAQTKVGNYLEATGILEATEETGWTAEERYKKYVSLGLLYLRTDKYKKSEYWLTKALSEGPVNLHAYIYYGLGHSYLELNNLKTSLRYLRKVFAANVPSYLENLARHDIVSLAMQKKSWKMARRQLMKLRRSWRNTPRAPMIDSQLLTVNLKLNKKRAACVIAKNLFKKYPGYEQVASWDLDLKSAKWKGQRLRCNVSTNDQIQRVKRLIWQGFSERAESEVAALLKRSPKRKSFSLASVEVERLVREGHLDLATKKMMKYYSSSQKNIEYWMLLAKVLGRARHFNASVGAYLKANALSPRSRRGQRALFYAAFLSYQSGDYDGAQGKFLKLVKGSFRKKTNRDALWYLAWIRYLKKDYIGAAIKFEELALRIQKRRGRWWNLPLNRVRYWLGVAHLKNGATEQASVILSELAKDPLKGYYSLAAKYRLESFPSEPTHLKVVDGPKLNAQKTTGSGKTQVDLDAYLRVLQSPSYILPKVVAVNSGQRQPASVASTQLQKDTEIIQAEELVQDGLSQHAKTNKHQFLPSPQWIERWSRIEDLVEIGFDGWARWELYTVERRTKGPEILRKVMETYHEIEAFHRSTYIAEVYFASVRVAMGLKGKYLWGMAFPLAFKSQVDEFSQKFDVDKYFMYSIMKAESRFKKDVVSPVGAKGLMQLMPFTARQLAGLLGDSEFNVSELTRPEVNIRLGTRYLSRLLKKFNRQIPLAAAAYNAGPHRVNSWLKSFGSLDMDEFIEHIPFGETRKYVKRVVKYYAIYNSLYGESAPEELNRTDQKPTDTGLSLAQTVSSIPDAKHSFRESWAPTEGLAK